MTKGKNKLRVMQTMIRLVAETSSPIDFLEKDEIVLHMSGMYKVILSQRHSTRDGFEELLCRTVVCV